MRKTTNVTAALYEEPVCVTLCVDAGEVICESYADSNVEDYGRSEFEW